MRAERGLRALRAAALVCLLAVGACGQRGPLSLPEPETPPPANQQGRAGDEDENDDER